MTRSSTPTAAFTKRWLASLRQRDDATVSSLAEGPAWRSRTATPARLSPVLGLFFAALATSPLGYAGDLLRGGAAQGTRGSVPGANPSSAQATAQARANAQDVLSRTTQALKAVQAMQNAARGSAVSGADNLGRNPVNGLQLPNVPNGLTPGGLVVAPGGVWKGAKLPQQTASNGQTFVDIQQTTSQAILTWQSFNIGKKTTLSFDQDFGGSQSNQWIVFNKVNDPTGVPSQILGSIRASGQVFVINRNGIIFGGSSQVNAHAFFASSLPINNNLISSGLLANPDQQFLFSGLAIPAGPSGTPAFTPDAPYNADYGDVTVQPGATFTAPTTSSHVGGR
ncbi:MAG TPA: filamentous hemagglutinin N-terminal domain-containing protein, partial [Chthoniobacter sp.]|nr:filamentous hemagglutinin N-terminal domain-containing protein [Chthoniobacter sp.]